MRKNIGHTFLVLLIAFLLEGCSVINNLIGENSSLNTNTTSNSAPKNIQGKTILENIGEPLSGREANGVRILVERQIKMLKKLKGVEVESIRKGEVMKITVPAALLFQPNETKVWDRADPILRSLLRYIEVPQYNNMLIAVHTDDTGNSPYLKKLSQERAIALTKWFSGHGAKKEEIAAYALGGDLPKYENNSEINRNKNRRIEFLIIPSDLLIEDVKKGRLP